MATKIVVLKDDNGDILLPQTDASVVEGLPEISGKADKVSGATSGNFAALDANGNLTDSGHKHSDYLTTHQDISGKADKVSNATNGHLAGLDGNGNLTDSGKSASDFQPTIDSSNKLPYSLISGTPTIPTVVSMSAADISTAVDTAWNAVMS